MKPLKHKEYNTLSLFITSNEKKQWPSKINLCKQANKQIKRKTGPFTTIINIFPMTGFSKHKKADFLILNIQEPFKNSDFKQCLKENYSHECKSFSLSNHLK